MKLRHIYLIEMTIALASLTGQEDDPIKKYLSLQESPVFVSYRGDMTYHSDDKMFVMRIDLNNDGQEEVLVTTTLDIDGRHGNVWTVYSATSNGLSESGTLIFSPARFYLGPLANGAFGLATFSPYGAGEGAMLGYVFDGARVTRTVLGGVTTNARTGELEGTEIIDYYLGENAMSGDRVTRVISASELAGKYGVIIDKKTYRESVMEELGSAAPLPIVESVSSRQPGSPTSVSSPNDHDAPSAQPSSQAEAPRASHSSTSRRWAIGGLLLLLFIGGSILLNRLLRK